MERRRSYQNIKAVVSFPLYSPQTSANLSLGIADPGSVELTDDEVVKLVQTLGFDIIHEGSVIDAPYIQDKQSMLQNTYKASHWVARKR